MIQEKRKACRVLVENTEGNRPLGRPTSRYNDNIKEGNRPLGRTTSRYNDNIKEGNRPLGRPTSRYNDNIKMDIKVIQEAVDWNHAAHDRGKWWAV
jgi:hypothetical protein